MTKQQFSLVVAAVCGYELAAIASMGKIPTLTELNRRYRHSVSVPILLGLAVHFYCDWPEERVLDGQRSTDWRVNLPTMFNKETKNNRILVPRQKVK